MMNGYDLTRAWYNFKFKDPKRVKSGHSDLFFYIIDLWNRLGQKKEFGLPTSVAMESLGIGSYNTYKKLLDDLFKFGFIKLICDSKNQHQSKIITISKIDKASDEALDKATIKASDEATDTILISKDIKNKEQQTKNNSKSHYGGKPPKPKKEISHWKVMVDLWFEFYKSKFEVNPSFNATSGKSLKSILIRLEKLSVSKKIEWTEEIAKKTMRKFFEQAWDDVWMQENFLLPNLSSKYDSIINKKQNHNGKSVNNPNSNTGYKPAKTDSERIIRELESDFENGNIPGMY